MRTEIRIKVFSVTINLMEDLILEEKKRKKKKKKKKKKKPSFL